MLALTTTIPDNTVESGTKTVNQKGYLEYLNTTLKDEQDRYNELLVNGTKAKEIYTYRFYGVKTSKHKWSGVVYWMRHQLLLILIHLQERIW